MRGSHGVAAVLSVVAMLGLGGLMYWNDQQGTAHTAQASTSFTTGSSSSDSTVSHRSEREGGEGGEGDGEHESDDEGGSIVDDIASLIPGLGNASSSSNTSNGTSNAGTSQQRSVPAPHTNTRGS